MEQTISRTQTLVLATNRVIRNTYLLLTLTLLTSAAAAGVAMAVGAQPINWFIMIAVFIGMPFVIYRFRDSVWSLPLTFLFTGFMGYVLGPILTLYLGLPNGPQIVLSAFATTAVMFTGLSAYALATQRDFSFMRGFLFVGLIVVLLAIVANLFLAIPALSLTISAAAVILMSGLILYDTSRMLHGGETNYVVMTVSLYANIYVLFTHLLNLFTAMAGHE
ncbi:MAG: Bax inhibitor-1/YccA family protein [Gammaproteobacteria bacterium]|nr:Bax inhibitor-1/YccA family protein [Gammaproteobacteria bacterium]MDD9868512.1 Bax inhibitor-1/YccA family protein [Gammaproteobacteria bacterium]MDD9886672.1 Bax inhibitor-1/YccA family protein [Gammaproteobacteria bacterium]